MIRSIEGFTFASALNLYMGYYHIKLDAGRWCSKAMNNLIHMAHGKIKIQTLNYGYQDCLVSDDFQNIMCKLVQDMEYIKTYLDDLLILTKRIKQLQRPST
jgi:hypothetical protein